MRTKAALQAAKARGTQLGGRRVSAERFAEIAAQGRKVRIESAQALRSELLPTITQIQAGGASSLRQIAAELNSIHTSRRQVVRRSGAASLGRARRQRLNLQDRRLTSVSALACIGRGYAEGYSHGLWYG
jgi:hypothetical protein